MGTESAQQIVLYLAFVHVEILYAQAGYASINISSNWRIPEILR